MADIVIRELRVTDLEVVWSINQENVPAVGEETLEDLAKIHEESAIALVAEVSGNIAGFCMVLLPDADYGSPNFEFFCDRLDDFVYLDRVAVTSDFQGKGIGAGGNNFTGITVHAVTWGSGKAFDQGLTG